MQSYLNKQVITLLNLEYRTTLFGNPTSLSALLQVGELALRKGILQVKYGLSNQDIIRYGINLPVAEQAPFPPNEIDNLKSIIRIGQALITQQPQYDTNQQLKKLNMFCQNMNTHLELTTHYQLFAINFKYLNLKQAIIYSALSQCRIWFTICRERKRSGKSFHMDTLINYFDYIVQKAAISNAYDIRIMPRKHVKQVEKKNNKLKNNNILFKQVSKANYKEVTDLILNGADIQGLAMLNTRSCRQVRSTHRACLNGDIKMCKLLNSFGVNWEAEDNQKMTPLFYAIQSANLPLIQYLIEDIKVNIQKAEIQQRTPFYWACTQGDMHIIEYLYHKGANINNKSSLGRSALSKSCYLGRVDVTRFLLSCPQIELYSQDKKGRTALHNAVFGPKGGRQGHKFGTNTKDSPQCAQLLLQNNFEVNFRDYQDNTALHIAMSSQAIDSIRLLMIFGGSLTATNNYGQTAIMTGSKFGHLQAVKLLYQQYGSSIHDLDSFNKNIILLTARFRQYDQNNNEIINNVFTYVVDLFIRQSQISQLYHTFQTLVENQVAEEIIYFAKKCTQANIKLPTLTQSHLQHIINMQSIIQHPNNSKVILHMLQQSPPKLTDASIQTLVSWVLKHNNLKMLEFLHQHQHLLFQNGPMFQEAKYQLPIQPLVQQMIPLKQRVITYCLLNLPLNWLCYIQDTTGNNILHCLIRHKKVGTLIQVMKVLSGKQMKFISNPHLKLKQPQLWRMWECKLLQHKNMDGFNAYDYAQMLKSAQIIKMLEPTCKDLAITSQQHWDVKDYKTIAEHNQQQLQIFNMGYEKQQELAKLIQNITHTDELQSMYPILNYKSSLKQTQQQWANIDSRPLSYISNIKDFNHLQPILKSDLIGIDIEYVNQEGVVIISLLQMSTNNADYIIDMLTVVNENLYYQFVHILREKYIKPIAYNANILKVMHGADHDLHLLKSIFNISLVNFVDTARTDLQLRTKNEIRGLATLCKEYMGITMFKDYQVSQWRIRPIPKAMLDYARRDSFAVVILIGHMLRDVSTARRKQLLINGCKQARKNRKIHQNLVRHVIII